MSDAAPMLTPADMRFLVEFRDYLNSAAYPASGSTIAFSTFVSDGHRLGDALLAYPGYVPLARKLRSSLFRLRILALASTILVAVMGAYVYWGNAIVTSMNNALTQQDSLAKDISREEATGVTRLDASDYRTPMAGSVFINQIVHISGTSQPMGAQATTISVGFLGLCDAIEYSDFGGNRVRVFLSSTQEYLCNQDTSIKQQIGDFQTEAETWYSFSHHLLPYQAKSFRNSALLMRVAPHELSVINGYAIPLAMGFLGSAAFVLRSFLQRLGDRVLTTRDVQSNRVRLVLGVLSGLAIGFFLSPSGNGGSPTDALGLGISLTAPALAFLAGYAVDVLFRFLDTLAGRTFSVK